MSRESLTVNPIEVVDVIEDQLVFDEHGSLPDEILMPQYGITSEEARAVVTFGNRTGTFAQMVADEGCPVGPMLKAAHTQGGVEAVRQKLGKIEELFETKLAIEIADKTPEHYKRVEAKTVSSLEFTVPKKKR